jgi:hypothetical protein
VECKAESPEALSHYSLIAKHGWRLVRPQGAVQTGVEWRCPACWTAYKARQPVPSSSPLRAARPAPVVSEESVEAGKMFDRALQALTTRPPGKSSR